MEIINGQIELTSEEFEQLNSMCYGIAKKRDGWSNLQLDDLAMELWIKAIEVIKGTKEVNYRWIGRCLWNRVTDICRQAKKYKERNIAAAESFESYGDNEENLPFFKSRVREDFDSSVKISEIFNLFEPDSREYKYVSLMICYTGVNDKVSSLSKINFRDLFGNARREYEIAVKLGFSNDTSSGYRNLRNRVRQQILDYEAAS